MKQFVNTLSEHRAGLIRRRDAIASKRSSG